MSIGLEQFDPQPGVQAPKEHSFYDFVKDILLPAAPTIGMLLSLKAPLRFALFFFLTLVFVGLGVYPRIAGWWRSRKELAKDADVAAKGLTALRQLVKRFGDFVNTGFGGSLHYLITSELSPSTRNQVGLCAGGPTLALWAGFWSFLKIGLDTQTLTLDNLKFGVMEFHHLIVQFNNLCVSSVFDRMDSELRQKLTDTDKSKLNGFQQRYSAFVAEYEQFAQTLADSRPSLQDLPRFLPHSNPL